MEYEQLLSKFDCLPALWPCSPAWPHDHALRAKLSKPLQLPGHELELVLENGLQQRRMEACWRHFRHLADAADPRERRPPARWVDELCDASGWDGEAVRSSGGAAPVTAQEFSRLAMRPDDPAARMQLGRRYTPPTAPIPRACDTCKGECLSECSLCGESFCSRAWLRFRSLT